MYLSTHLSFTVLPNCEGLELLAVVISNECFKSCILLFYRPPSSSFTVLDSLHCFIESLLTFQYSSFIILGDFNISFCPHSSHPLFSRLEALASSFGLQQLITEPTHNHHTGSASTIDLVFVSTVKLVDHCAVIPPLHNSDHNSIFLGCYWKLSA